MRTPSLLFVLVALGSCDRTEEPRSTEPRPERNGGRVHVPESQPKPPRQRAKEPAASRPAAPRQRCPHPLADPPPPRAEPAANCPTDPLSEAPRLPLGKVTFVDAPSQPEVEVELALEPAARTRGLMYRTQLGRSRGMLFSWNDQRIRSFWMRNTCIPLDMLFIDADGTIVGILERVPTLNDAPRGVPCPAAHVLEVNAGWAREHGARPGQKLRIEAHPPPKGSAP
jgi:uncharacterized membrane protein (UPF0127 family)